MAGSHPHASWEEKGRKLFAGSCDFVAGATSLEILPPPSCPEFAFIGRSNVGKSSLINALTGRKTLARVSHTPGRTAQLNFFLLGGKGMLVDLPGYGYAKVSRKESAAWGRLILGYLETRGTLQRVYLLIDARHGIKPSDEHMMEILDEAAISYQIILTKSDKARKAEMEKCAADIERALAAHPALCREAIATSVREKAGITQLRAEIASLILS